MDLRLAVDLPETQPSEEGISHFRWGTVTGITPLTVRLDGDSLPLAAEPESLVDPATLQPGTRVWVQLFARRVLVLGSPRGKPNIQQLTSRMQVTLLGGKNKTVTASGSVKTVKWNSRFIAISVENTENRVRNGYFQIDMPPVGTVIPSLSDPATPSTVTANGVSLVQDWGALWYLLPFGEGYASKPGNFFITNYFGNDFEVPLNAILIAISNDDAAGNSSIKWGTGEISDYWHPLTLLNGWLTFSALDTPPSYMKRGDVVYLRGLIKSGTVTSGTILANLPVGYRSSFIIQFSTVSNSAFGSGSIQANGDILFRTGSNVWFSLDGLSFIADS